MPLRSLLFAVLLCSCSSQKDSLSVPNYTEVVVDQNIDEYLREYAKSKGWSKDLRGETSYGFLAHQAGDKEKFNLLVHQETGKLKLELHSPRGLKSSGVEEFRLLKWLEEEKELELNY